MPGRVKTGHEHLKKLQRAWVSRRLQNSLGIVLLQPLPASSGCYFLLLLVIPSLVRHLPSARQRACAESACSDRDDARCQEAWTEGWKRGKEGKGGRGGGEGC
eukprot:1721449-Rhodomonas_salina.1